LNKRGGAGLSRQNFKGLRDFAFVRAQSWELDTIAGMRDKVISYIDLHID